MHSHVNEIIFVQDYTGKDLTPENLFAVILGNKSLVKGGSGKVVDSGPNDRIFIYYTDHGGSGILGEYLDVIIQFVIVPTRNINNLINVMHFGLCKCS